MKFSMPAWMCDYRFIEIIGKSAILFAIGFQLLAIDSISSREDELTKQAASSEKFQSSYLSNHEDWMSTIPLFQYFKKTVRSVTLDYESGKINLESYQKKMDEAYAIRNARIRKNPIIEKRFNDYLKYDRELTQSRLELFNSLQETESLNSKSRIVFLMLFLLGSIMTLLARALEFKTPKQD